MFPLYFDMGLKNPIGSGSSGLGYLDDLIIVPFGIALALKMIPRSVIDDCRIRAEEIRQRGKPKNWIAGALFIVIWILCAFWIGSICYRWVR